MISFIMSIIVYEIIGFERIWKSWQYQINYLGEFEYCVQFMGSNADRKGVANV